MSTQILTGTQADQKIAEEAKDPFWAKGRRRLTESNLLEAAQLMGRVFKGDRYATLKFQEALTSGDFRAAAFEILDREMLQRYADLPQTWSAYCRRTTVSNFKPKRMIDLLGGRAGLDPIGELGEYPERQVSKALYALSVGKFGGRFQISWESIVNDELGEIQNMPEDLAIAARDTESRVAAGLLTDGNGPNDAYFNATAWGRTFVSADPTTMVTTWTGGSSNLMTGNPALTVDSLTTALTEIGQRRDLEGRPIAFPGLVLVVPQALEVAASQIVNAVQIRATNTGVAGNGEQVLMTNWLAGKIKVVVEPWLSVLDKSANANTTWYIVPDPAVSRPAFSMGFLRGHETPDLRVKADAGNSIGGGPLAAEEGSFDVDDIQYRVRHVVGAAGTDMIGTLVSNGSGS